MDTAIVTTFIVICIIAVFIPATKAAQQISPYYGLEKEIPTIRTAAARNNCNGKLFTILLAIRKAENGRPGREFGIMNPAAYNLDLQAGWAAATITKNYQRYKDQCKYQNATCVITDFIEFLSDRYVDKIKDPQGHKNWRKNVKHWFLKFEATNG